MSQQVDWGVDLDWWDDLDPTGRTVSGTKLLAQAAYHRLITPKGSCLDSPDDGMDINEYLSLDFTPADLANIPSEIRHELLKDERFIGVDVDVTPFRDNTGFDLKITITPSAGPDFELVISVAQAATKLLSFKESSS